MTPFRASPVVHLSNNQLKNILVPSLSFFPRGIHFITSILRSSPSFTAYVDSGSSPQPNKLPIQQFLQTSCGLLQKAAILASKPLFHLKSIDNPEQVLKFFKERGFSDAQIQNMVTRRPQVLTSSVHKTLQPKLRVFEDVGIVGTDLGCVISKDPRLLRVSAERKLAPGIYFLKKMLHSNENVAKVLMRDPWILRVHLEKRLKPNFIFLQNSGVDLKLLWKIFVSHPRFLTFTETVIKDAVTTVDKLGVPRHSGMFLHAIFLVCSMKKTTLERKIKSLISLGLSEEEVLVAIRKTPYILSISEKNLRNHMDFLVNTLKYEPSVLVLYPRFFMFSLEAKIIPRYRVLQMLKSKQLPKKSFSVLNMLCLSEKRFLERFVYKYGKSANLYETYKQVDSTEPSTHT